MNRKLAIALLSLGLVDLAWINYNLHPLHWGSLYKGSPPSGLDPTQLAKTDGVAPPPPQVAPKVVQAGVLAPKQAPKPEPDFADIEPEYLLRYRVVGSSSLSSSARATLRRVARRLRQDPALLLELRGHSDQQGDAQENQALSQARAQAAKAYLTGSGIDAARITVQARGASELANQRNTYRARYANRRVELRLLRVSP